MFQQVRDTVYRGIAGHISVGAGNDYMAARSPAANGWNFSISNVPGGDDQYVNRFSVSIASTGKSADLRMNGSVHVYKEVSKMRFWTAGPGPAATSPGAASFPSRSRVQAWKIADEFRTDSNRTNHDTNRCADAFSWIGRILGGVLDVFTGFGDRFFFSNLVSNAFSVSVPGIGNVSVG